MMFFVYYVPHYATQNCNQDENVGAYHFRIHSVLRARVCVLMFRVRTLIIKS